MGALIAAHQLDLPADSNVRDGLDLVALAQIIWPNHSPPRIMKEECSGTRECEQGTGRASHHARRAVDEERKHRQPRLDRGPRRTSSGPTTAEPREHSARP